MAYNYLGLVNEIAAKVNEVPLDSSNFTTSVAFYSVTKDAVNRAIREINMKETFWRFNYAEHTETLVAGTLKYNWPTNTKVIDFDSFRIEHDNSLNVNTQWLRPITYKEYIKRYSNYEYDTDTSLREVPRYVVSLPDTKYLIFPAPDAAYSLTFDTFTDPSDLVNWDDIPNIPERYRPAIFHGAMRDIYSFRQDDFNMQMAESSFTKLLEEMRIREVNHYDYVPVNMIVRNQGGSNYGHSYPSWGWG